MTKCLTFLWVKLSYSPLCSQLLDEGEETKLEESGETKKSYNTYVNKGSAVQGTML